MKTDWRPTVVDKVHENRVRRWAKRLDHRLERSRARMLHHNNRGQYQLIDSNNVVVAGNDYDAALARIEACLSREEKRLIGGGKGPRK